MEVPQLPTLSLAGNCTNAKHIAGCVLGDVPVVVAAAPTWWPQHPACWSACVSPTLRKCGFSRMLRVGGDGGGSAQLCCLLVLDFELELKF